MNWITFFNRTIYKSGPARFMFFSVSILAAATILACSGSSGKPQALDYENPDAKIIFLHHSTGGRVWNGGASVANPLVLQLMKTYNEENGKQYAIAEQAFPKQEPYGWKNYPYDYYNIWVKNGGNETFEDEPTLEILTQQYDVIIFKHCFPVSNVLEDTGSPDIDSDEKRLENYRLQYNALKDKMNAFPNTKFIVWTSAALTEASTTQENAQRSREFVNWVKETWDEDGDNIFIFDFWTIETDGDLYLKANYAAGETDSHPNDELSRKASELFVSRIIDIIENGGRNTMQTGEKGS